MGKMMKGRRLALRAIFGWLHSLIGQAAFFVVQQDYIHKVPVILHDKLQQQSRKPYGPPAFVT
jgi:hypothetical protein